MNKILSVKDLSVSYDGKKILSDINFDIYEGDFLCIFGENGSGKSSLIKTVLGLKAPSKGKVEFPDKKDKFEIGYLPQLIKLQEDFPASSYEVVLSGCLNRMKGKFFYGKKEKAEADKNMALLGIENLKNECFRNLSGGQKQRVLLARALCACGKMLLLDEPTSGLDPFITAEFYELIVKINASGIAVCMVSHDVHSSLSVAKHVLQIGNSSVLFYGTPGEYENTVLTESCSCGEHHSEENEGGKN